MSNNTNSKPFQFIPSGSEIVIFRNGQHEWYTTKKEIPVETATTVNCPIRNVDVLTMDYMSYPIFFLESQVIVRLTEEQEQAAKNLQLSFLQYDIPASVSRAGAVEHPSHYLWSMGVRTSLSCWVVPNGNIPWIRLRELTRAGCTWHVTRVDVSEAPNLMQRAVAALQVERAEAIRRNAESIRAAHERAQNGNGSEIQRQRTLRYTLTRIEKALAEALDNVANGAKALGIPQSWIEYASVRSVTRALSAGYHAEAERVGAIVDAAKSLGTSEGDAVAEAVENNQMPADIANDYLEENGVYNLTDGQDEEE